MLENGVCTGCNWLRMELCMLQPLVMVFSKNEGIVAQFVSRFAGEHGFLPHEMEWHTLFFFPEATDLINGGR